MTAQTDRVGQVKSRASVAERTAAAMAIVTLAAAIVLLLVAAARNLAGLLLGVLGVFIAVVAGWYVVSRRGVVRGVALVCLVAALVPPIWGVAISDLRPLALAAVLVIAAISVGCARVALRRTRRARRAAALERRDRKSVV